MCRTGRFSGSNRSSSPSGPATGFLRAHFGLTRQIAGRDEAMLKPPGCTRHRSGHDAPVLCGLLRSHRAVDHTSWRGSRGVRVRLRPHRAEHGHAQCHATSGHRARAGASREHTTHSAARRRTARGIGSLRGRVRRPVVGAYTPHRLPLESTFLANGRRHAQRRHPVLEPRRSCQ